jgi:hypothetical protein
VRDSDSLNLECRWQFGNETIDTDSVQSAPETKKKIIYDCRGIKFARSSDLIVRTSKYSEERAD